MKLKIKRVASRFFGWNKWDFIKAGALSALVAALEAGREMLMGDGVIVWAKVGNAVLVAAAAYLIKNLPPQSSPLSTDEPADCRPKTCG